MAPSTPITDNIQEKVSNKNAETTPPLQNSMLTPDITNLEDYNILRGNTYSFILKEMVTVSHLGLRLIGSSEFTSGSPPKVVDVLPLRMFPNPIQVDSSANLL